jgi:hypothetical protein
LNGERSVLDAQALRLNSRDVVLLLRR